MRQLRGWFGSEYEYFALCHDAPTADAIAAAVSGLATVFIADAPGEMHALASLFESRPTVSAAVTFSTKIDSCDCETVRDLIAFHCRFPGQLTVPARELTGVLPAVIGAEAVRRLVATGMSPQPNYTVVEVAEELIRAGLDTCAIRRFVPSGPPKTTPRMILGPESLFGSVPPAYRSTAVSRRQSDSPAAAPSSVPRVLLWSSLAKHPDSALPAIGDSVSPDQWSACTLVPEPFRSPIAMPSGGCLAYNEFQLDRICGGSLAFCDRALADLSPDILHLETTRQTPLQVVASIRHIPTVLSVPERATLPDRDCLEMADTVLCESESQLRTLFSRYGNCFRGVVCPSPVGGFAGRNEPARRNVYEVAMIGPISEAHGQAVLIEAIARAVKDVPELRTIILDESTQADELCLAHLRNLIARQCLQNVVEIRSASDRWNVLRDVSAVVFGVTEYPMSRLLRQALRAGAGVIGPAGSWFEELVGDAREFSLYRKDDPDHLAGKIIELRRQPFPGRRLAGVAINQAATIEDVYRSLHSTHEAEYVPC